MGDFDELIKLIKKAATEAVLASNPASFLVGTVVSVKPLQIRIDQKLTLGDGQFFHTKAMAGLTEGKQVLLARVQGGQKYIVLDEVVQE